MEKDTNAQRLDSTDADISEKVTTNGNKDLNDMVAKVTIETPSGSSTKYYLLYRDRCFSTGSLLTGALGGIGIGFYSRIFFEQWRRPQHLSIINKLPFTIPQVKLAVKFNGKQLSIPLLFGNTVWWRVASRAVVSSIIYCAVECQLQGTWYRRSYFDCGLAGAVTGALFGLRGIPGGYHGAGIGACGFGAFAILSRFVLL